MVNNKNEIKVISVIERSEYHIQDMIVTPKNPEKTPSKIDKFESEFMQTDFLNHDMKFNVLIENYFYESKLFDNMSRKKKSLNEFKKFVESSSNANNIEKIIHSISEAAINEEIKNDLINSINEHKKSLSHEKLLYSAINFMSKYVDIADLKCSVSVQVDKKTGLISVDISRKSTLNYMVILSLQFSENGNVSFFVRDNDKNDSSHIHGIVKKYDSLLSSYKFKSLLDVIYYGG
ncbi:MAG: hypothetical protein ABF665_16165 [Gluconacetobacter sp.]